MSEVIENDRVVFFDVDDTLILWNLNELNLPLVEIGGRSFQVHSKHVQKIKDYHLMGFKVFVWSNSGHKWAAKVCDALQISPLVTAMCKPHRVFDDAKSLDDTIGHGYIKLV